MARLAAVFPASAATAALLLSTLVAAADLPRPVSEYFAGFEACALVLRQDRYDQSRLELGAAQCALPLSPCSTFKIPHALIGLQTGVIDGPGHLKTWDGRLHAREANNRDHTLASAIEHSVVWYFQSLARDVGEEAMAAWLDRLDYGNGDISGGIDRFWLGSTLEIDAYRQLELIRALWRSGLPFDERHQRAVAAMLARPSDLPGTLHGKTGSCRGSAETGKPDHGWFVGWIDWSKNRPRNPATSWFAINIIGAGADGETARRITLQLLADLQP
jgi:beta-lactamase class D